MPSWEAFGLLINCELFLDIGRIINCCLWQHTVCYDFLFFTLAVSLEVSSGCRSSDILIGGYFRHQIWISVAICWRRVGLWRLAGLSPERS